jgi:predicted O-methyltransferase YrrM
MATYQSRIWVPPLVQQATELAQRMGFENSCIPEVGQLLGVLAAGVRGGTIGEVGTGCGVGAAWLAGGLATDSRFVTVEANGERAASAAALFRDHSNVQVLHGDWHDILAHGPFDLLFVDASPAKYDEPAAVVESLRPGGLVVLDDLTPEEYWPPEWQGRPDVVRAFWLNDARLRATEVLTTPRTAAILATRIG